MITTKDLAHGSSLLIALVSCIAQAEVSQIESTSRSVAGKPQPLDTRQLEGFIHDQMANGLIPNAAVCVVNKEGAD